MTTPIEPAVIRALQARVAAAISRRVQDREAAGLDALPAEDEHQLALALIDQVVANHVEGLLAAGGQFSDRLDEWLAAAVHAALFGTRQLDELLDEPTVQTITLYGCDEVWVTYADNPLPRRHRPLAATDEDLVAIIGQQAARTGRSLR